MSVPSGPSADIPTLVKRAGLNRRIRRFFEQHDVLEVTTPALSRHANTDLHIDSFVTAYVGPSQPDGLPFYLHTSPEFPMKRLLVAGSGSIYQIAQVFRDGEFGRHHNPEFTLLEWYRLDFDHHRLMDEIEQLLKALCVDGPQLPAAQRLTYDEVLHRYAGLSLQGLNADALRVCCRDHGLDGIELGNDVDAWLDLLFSHHIQPNLPEVCFVYDYPASQAALARVRHDEPPVAERFELFINGIELGNGYHELSDAEEQLQRFQADTQKRAEQGKADLPMDTALINALQDGLPNCAGVAIGLDRLYMVLLGKSSIAEVMAFPWDRA